MATAPVPSLSDRLRARSPLIIAELGVNHDGSLERALALVESAAWSGADAIKLQHFRARSLLSGASTLAAYQARAGECDPIDMLRRLELSIDDQAVIAQRAKALGMLAIVTVFSLEHAPEALALPWDMVKSASPDIVHRPLLEALAASGKPVIVSTGASTLGEVERAVGWLLPITGPARLALLQCVSSYPTLPQHAAVGGIVALRRAFPELAVGYSDHTTDLDTGALAVSMGACILEKHLTHNRAAAGPDHAASLEPAQLTEYIRLARRVGNDAAPPRSSRPGAGTAAGPDALRTAGDRRSASRWPLEPWEQRIGPLEKTVQPCEHDVRHVSRQSIVARRTLAPGAVLTRQDVCFKRPGTGLEPFRLEEALGRTMRCVVDADQPIEPAAVGLEPLARPATQTLAHAHNQP